MSQNGTIRHDDSAILLSLWEAARAAPYGIGIKSLDIEHLRRKLFFFRIDLRKQGSGTSPYDHLCFRSDPKDLTRIFLVPKEKLDG